MVGGAVTIVLSQTADLALLLAAGLDRVASARFLRLATLALAQALDLVTFSVMVGRHGLIAEANPLVSDLFATYGMPAVAFLKLALVLVIGSLCVAASARGGRGVWAIVGGLPLALAITAGLIGGITNAASYLG